MDPMIGALANPGLPDIMKSYYGAGGGHDVSDYVRALDPQAGIVGHGAEPPTFASPEDQKMLNADVPMSPDRANQIYDSYARTVGNNDPSIAARASDPYSNASAGMQTSGMGSLLTDVSKLISPEQLQRLLGAPMYGQDDIVRPAPGFTNPSGGAY